MLGVAMGTLLGHGFSAALAPTDPPNLGTFARSAPLRNPGLAAPAERAGAHPTATSPAREDGSRPLGHAGARLDRMASAARYRQTGDRDRLAPTGLSTLVDLEESTPDGATDGARRHPHVDSDDGGGEPALGCAADPRRTLEAWDRPVAELLASERARVRNRETGFTFQSFNLIGDLTVFENVELPLMRKA